MHIENFSLFGDDEQHAHIPSPPSLIDDPRATLASILHRLSGAFSTDADGRLDRALAQLALYLTKWLDEPYPLRLCIVGPTGSGKTHLLNVVASIVRLPSIIIPVTDLAETNWRGPQIGDACRILHPSLFTTYGEGRKLVVPTATVTKASVLMLDEIDKIATVAHDGSEYDGPASATRIGRQQSLLAVLDPLSDVLVDYDDAQHAFRWSLKNSVVICAGAFAMLPDSSLATPADLVRVGLSPEFVDRMGPILSLPSPSAATRSVLARSMATEAMRFASRLGVTVTGIDALVASLPAPGPHAPYIGVRGLQHYVEQQVFNGIADALTRNAESVDLGPAADENASA